MSKARAPPTRVIPFSKIEFSKPRPRSRRGRTSFARPTSPREVAGTLPGFLFYRGEGGSRTHVGLAPKPDFESGAFGHSATSPEKRPDPYASAPDLSTATAEQPADPGAEPGRRRRALRPVDDPKHSRRDVVERATL